MAFDKSFLDTLRDRISLYDLISKKIKLTKRNRDYLGLCPFHGEKTPSFTVSEERGSYHCFGCGAHGDIITFEMETNHLSFHEAVERLAQQAGLEMPEFTPEDRKKFQAQAGLQEVLEMATKFFEKKLFENEGLEALEYIKKKRGFSGETLSTFRVGFAPKGNQLYDFLKDNKVDLQIMKDAGLVGESAKDGKPYDYFRNRIIFPITNVRGQVIAFTARVMDDSQPKYLNSPETLVFQKNRTLYGFSQARETAFEKKRIIAVEGNIDVISLHQHGIKNVVAPLGTAITEHHINLLWKVSDTPYFCLDGDAAGYKAGIRTAMRALPILKEGKSIKFVLLDEKHDPDDLVRTKGKAGLQEYFQKAKSLSELLWDDLILRVEYKTPEQKAHIEKEVKDITNLIENATIKKYYESFFKDKMWELFRNKPNSQNGFKPTQNTNLVSKNDEIYSSLDKEILAYMIIYPQLFENLLEENYLYNSSDIMISNSFKLIIEKIMQGENLSQIEIENLIKENGFGGVLTSISKEINNIKIFSKSIAKDNLNIIILQKNKAIIEVDAKNSTDWKDIKELMNQIKELEIQIKNIENLQEKDSLK